MKRKFIHALSNEEHKRKMKIEKKRDNLKEKRRLRGKFALTSVWLCSRQKGGQEIYETAKWQMPQWLRQTHTHTHIRGAVGGVA